MKPFELEVTRIVVTVVNPYIVAECLREWSDDVSSEAANINSLDGLVEIIDSLQSLYDELKYLVS